MHTLKLEIEDSKLDVVLNIINNLEDNIVAKYEIINETKEQKDFINISQSSLEKVWDNQKDADLMEGYDILGKILDKSEED